MSILQNSVNANATTPLATVEGGSGVSSPTAHGILVAEGASAFNPIVLTNGQLLIGSTGADPVAATLTQGTGITITNAAGSITVAATGSAGSYVLLATATASSSASISFTGLTSTYFAYDIVMDSVIVASIADLYARFSVNNGSSYDSSALYSYQYVEGATTTADAAAGSSQTQLLLTSGTVATTTPTSGTVRIFNPTGSQTYKQVLSSLATLTTPFSVVNVTGSNYHNTTAVNAIEIFASTGNLSTGTFKLYGIAG